MTKHELRKLAKSKGVGFVKLNTVLFFQFPGEERAVPVNADSIKRVMDIELPKEPEQIIPDDAISLEGKTQEERDAAVLELTNKEN